MRAVPAHAEPRDAAAGALGPKLLAWWRYRGDVGEMQGRYRGDTGEISAIGPKLLGWWALMSTHPNPDPNQAAEQAKQAARDRAIGLQAELDIFPASPLHLPYISSTSPLYLAHISSTSPLYLAHISPISRRRSSMRRAARLPSSPPPRRRRRRRRQQIAPLPLPHLSPASPLPLPPTSAQASEAARERDALKRRLAEEVRVRSPSPNPSPNPNPNQVHARPPRHGHAALRRLRPLRLVRGRGRVRAAARALLRELQPVRRVRARRAVPAEPPPPCRRAGGPGLRHACGESDAAARGRRGRRGGGRLS